MVVDWSLSITVTTPSCTITPRFPLVLLSRSTSAPASACSPSHFLFVTFLQPHLHRVHPSIHHCRVMRPPSFSYVSRPRDTEPEPHPSTGTRTRLVDSHSWVCLMRRYTPSDISYGYHCTHTHSASQPQTLPYPWWKPHECTPTCMGITAVCVFLGRSC